MTELNGIEEFNRKINELDDYYHALAERLAAEWQPRIQRFLRERRD